MVDLLPIARSRVGGEIRQIACIGLDRVWRGILLLQMAKEIRHGFFDDGSRCGHH